MKITIRLVETDITPLGPVEKRPGETLWQAVQRMKREASAP